MYLLQNSREFKAMNIEVEKNNPTLYPILWQADPYEDRVGCKISTAHASTAISWQVMMKMINVRRYARWYTSLCSRSIIMLFCR